MGLELGLGLVLGGLASWSPQARPHLYKLVRVRVRFSSTSCLRPAAYSPPPPAVYHPRWQRTLNQLFPQLGVTVRKEGWLSKRGEGGAAKFTKRWCVHHRTIRCRCMRMHTHTPCTRHAHAMHTPYTRTRTRHAHAHVHVPCICRRCVLDSGYRLHSYKDKGQASQAMAKGHGHARPEQVRSIISTAAVSYICYTPYQHRDTPSPRYIPLPSRAASTWRPPTPPRTCVMVSGSRLRRLDAPGSSWPTTTTRRRAGSAALHSYQHSVPIPTRLRLSFQSCQRYSTANANTYQYECQCQYSNTISRYRRAGWTVSS